MIEIVSLRKVFGSFVAVDDVTFAAAPGEVIGFLGPNGAGKTTTMRMLTGFMRPTSGTARVFGHDIASEPLRAKAEIGYLPEGAPAYPDMTPESFLGFVADSRGVARSTRRRRISEVAERVRLGGVMRQPIETLSKGYKRRVGLAQALLHDPRALILDEPTDGLDPNQKHEVRELIRSIGKEKIIILSTHILEEVEAVCGRAVIIAHGRIVSDSTPSALQARSRFHNAVRVRLRAEAPGLEEALGSLPGVASTERVSGPLDLRVFPRSGAELLPLVNDTLRGRSASIVEVRLEQGRLDDVFRELTVKPAPPADEAAPFAQTSGGRVA